MENTSKGLIIAGAILISILLISLGLIIFNSQKSTTDQAAVVGEVMELNASDTADIIGGYTVKRYNGIIVEVENAYYKEFYTGIKLEENATYTISFDYTIEENEKNLPIGCGIGIGRNNPNAYSKDFSITQVEQTERINYPNQSIGEKGTFTFILKPNKYSQFNIYKNNYENLYLSLRLAKANERNTFKVRIENLKIKYK